MNSPVEIKSVGIAGAGTMGAGIAQVCASAGYSTILFDIAPPMLDKAKSQISTSLNKLLEKGKLSAETVQNIQNKIIYTAHLNELKADLIIEAVVEKLDIKQKLFAQLEEINEGKAILTSNTSSIPLTQIAASLKNPARMAGIHFFNPATIMKLVEVISGAQTDPDILSVCKNWVIGIGKTPVIAADSPGFIVNRVARPYYIESLKALEEKICSFEDMDALLESSAFKMGPFRLMDLIGVDTNYSVSSSLYELFNYENRFRPNRIQKQKVDAGLHGRKNGKGFYSYE